MKTMRKALALIMALAIVMSLGITAFAAQTPTYSITVKNDPKTSNVSIKGKVYSAYKLFDATYEGMPGESDTAGEGKKHAYTVNSDFTGFTFKTDAETETAGFENPTVINSENIINYVAALTTDSSAINAFSQKVYKYITENDISAKGTGKGVAGNPEKAEIDLSAEGAGAGYYLIFGTAAATDKSRGDLTSALILDTANPRPTVTAKVDAPTVDKVAGENLKSDTVEVGSTVPFKVTSKVPNMTGFKTYTMEFNDEFTTGLTVTKDDVTLKIGDKTYGTGGGKTAWDDNVTCTVEEQKLTVKIVDVKKVSGIDSQKDITLSYDATVNQNAVSLNKDENSVTLKYSNNPNDSNGYTTTPPKKVVLYNCDLDILKVDGNNTETKLKDAKFVLYRTDDGAVAGSNNHPVYYKQADSTLAVSWESRIEDASVRTTVAGGKLDKQFEGLEAGVYYLKETVPPAGYNLMNKDVKVEIKEVKENGKITGIEYYFDGEKSDTSISLGSAQIVDAPMVVNNAGSELPTTGGIGTTIFYTIGGLLMVTALALFITKKKMAA